MIDKFRYLVVELHSPTEAEHKPDDGAWNVVRDPGKGDFDPVDTLHILRKDKPQLGKKLNKLGELGWELVTCHLVGATETMYFKKTIRQQVISTMVQQHPEQALTLEQKARAEKMADKAMTLLNEYCSIGTLPSCYNNFKDYLSDFYPDLPWEPPALLHAIQYILAEHTAVLDRVKRMLDFDFKQELEQALKHV